MEMRNGTTFRAEAVSTALSSRHEVKVFSRPMLLRASRKSRLANVVNLQFLRGDLYGLPIRSDVFDSVVCVRVLNQLDGIENQKEVIKELYRVC